MPLSHLANWLFSTEEETMFFNSSTLVCTVALVLSPCCGFAAQGAVDKLSATALQRIHPVLLRHNHNCLLQVIVNVSSGPVKITAFTFSLEGTDDLGDLETLQLFYSAQHKPQQLDSLRSGIRFSGDRQTVRKQLTGAPFGGQVRPAAEVTFTGTRSLPAGEHIFWVSCRLRTGAKLTHQVDVQCQSIQTSAGVVTVRDLTPNVRKRIGIALRKHNDDGVHTCRIPALATTPRGTLLCVYDLRRQKRRDLQEDIDIGLSRSSDGGRSWEPVRVIMDMGRYGGLPQSQNGVSDPGIVVDAITGEIFCAAVWMWGKPGKHQWTEDGSEPGFEIGKSAQFLMVRSRDDGRSWTKPQNMTRQLKRREWILLAPAPQQGLSLRDGTLVMLGEGRDAQDRMFSALIVSRDHGKTWRVGAASATGNGECQAVQRNDGSILLNARSARPTKYRSVWVTKDLGETWQPHPTHRQTLIEPNCNGSLYRFDYRQRGEAKHVLFFANPYSQTGRDHHSIQASFDEGMSWPARHRLLLDEGRGNGYPSVSRVDDKHVGIVYEGSQSHLVFQKIAIEEWLQGTP